MTNDRQSMDVGLFNLIDVVKHDGDSAERIRRLEAIIDRELPKAIDILYRKIRATPAAFCISIDDADVSSVRDAQIRHWRSIVSGKIDSGYNERVRALGRAHSRIGVGPRWRHVGYCLILEPLISVIVLELWPKRLFRFGFREAANKVSAALGSLVKAVFIDMDLAISAYLEEDSAMRAQSSAERDRAVEDQRLAVERLSTALAKLARKDLTSRATGDMPESFRRLQHDFNSAVERLDAAFENIFASAGRVGLGAQDIAAASSELSLRIGQQGSGLKETAAAVDEIAATAGKSAEGANQAGEAAAIARDEAQKCGGTIRQAVDAMSKLEQSSSQIARMIGVIDEIAFQTKLLGVNGGIEAARAGDAGRGFFAVASEVRALAQRSVDAIKEIKGLILASSAQASEGVALIAKTGEALQRIERKASEIDAVVSNIASWAQKQAAGIAQVSAAAGRRDEVARQSAALVEQTIVASRRLGNDSRKLSSLIGQFRFQNCAGESLRRELKSLAPHAFQDRAELPESAGDRDPVASWSPPIRSIGPAIGESSPPNASNGRREGRTAASSGAGTGDGAVPDRRTGGTWKEF